MKVISVEGKNLGSGMLSQLPLYGGVTFAIYNFYNIPWKPVATGWICNLGSTQEDR